MCFSLSTHTYTNNYSANFYKLFYCISKYTGIILNQRPNDILLTVYHPSTFNLETMKIPDALVVTLLTISALQVVDILMQIWKTLLLVQEYKTHWSYCLYIQNQATLFSFPFTFQFFKEQQATKKTKQKSKGRFHIVASDHSQDF